MRETLPVNKLFGVEITDEKLEFEMKFAECVVIAIGQLRVRQL